MTGKHLASLFLLLHYIVLNLDELLSQQLQDGYFMKNCNGNH